MPGWQRIRRSIIQDLIMDEHADEICITETWVEGLEGVFLLALCPPGFLIHHQSRLDGSQGGRVCIVYRSEISRSTWTVQEIPSSECLHVEVLDDEDRLRFCWCTMTSSSLLKNVPARTVGVGLKCDFGLKHWKFHSVRYMLLGQMHSDICSASTGVQNMNMEPCSSLLPSSKTPNHSNSLCPVHVNLLLSPAAACCLVL